MNANKIRYSKIKGRKGIAGLGASKRLKTQNKTKGIMEQSKIRFIKVFLIYKKNRYDNIEYSNTLYILVTKKQLGKELYMYRVIITAITRTVITVVYTKKTFVFFVVTLL